MKEETPLLIFKLEHNHYGIVAHGVTEVSSLLNLAGKISDQSIQHHMEQPIFNVGQIILRNSAQQDVENLITYKEGQDTFKFLTPKIRDVIQVQTSDESCEEQSFDFPFFIIQHEGKKVHCFHLNSLLHIFWISQISNVRQARIVCFENSDNHISRTLSEGLKYLGLELKSFSKTKDLKDYFSVADLESVDYFMVESELPQIDGYALIMELEKSLNKDTRHIIYNPLEGRSIASKVRIDFTIQPNNLEFFFQYLCQRMCSY